MHRTQVSKHVNIARAASCVRPLSFEPPAAGALRYRASRIPMPIFVWASEHRRHRIRAPVVGGRADRDAVDDAVSPLVLLTELVGSGVASATPFARTPTGDMH